MLRLQYLAMNLKINSLLFDPYLQKNKDKNLENKLSPIVFAKIKTSRVKKAKYQNV